MNHTPAANGADFVNAHLQACADNVSGTFQQIDPAVIDAVAEAVATARQVWLVGFRNSYFLAGYLRWQFVQVRDGVRLLPVAGETLGERAKSPACGQRDMQVLAREWVLGVEMLHARGIVHGRLSASNAIVDSNGRLTITHVSPLLYSDPDQDVADLIGVLLELLDVREELESPLGRLLERASAEGIPLRRLAARLGALIESRETETLAEPDGAVSRRIRRRAVVGAAATVAVGVAVFWGLREFSDARTPKPPVPPEAAPAVARPGPSSRRLASAVSRRAWQSER